MSPRQDYRDNPINWSLTMGQVFGIRVRLHLLFILWILFRLLSSIGDGMVAVWAVILLFFFVVVLFHEFGHCFGARRVGGEAEDILMWPLGGLATVHAPMKPRAQFLTTAAGPLVNLVLCLLSAPALLLAGGDVSLNPFHPFVFSTTAVTAWTPADWLGILWGVNYLILLFNLLPTFPLDGGRMLQAVLWARHGYRAATLTATFVGMIGAIVLGLAGLMNEQMILVCIAIFGYITCSQQRQMVKAGMVEGEGEWGYDFSRGYEAFEETPGRRPSWLARRRAARQARRAEADRNRQLEQEQRIDELLEKVHRQGIQALSEKEKKMLHQASEKKRH